MVTGTTQREVENTRSSDNAVTTVTAASIRRRERGAASRGHRATPVACPPPLPPTRCA